MAERAVWGIHAGRFGDANHQFLSQDMVALGWARVGDLKALAPDRESFKSAVLNAYPDTKAGAVPVYGGLLYRFVYEMKVGDLVVYPSQADRLVHIGEVVAEYKYRPDITETNPGTLADPYVNTRPVRWMKAVPRTSLTQGALYEMGSALSFFQIRNYADEIVAAVSGKAAPEVAAPDDDPSVGFVAADIEETTRDFILKTLKTELKGHPLSHFVADLMRTMGYRTRVAAPGPDGGVDIVASRDALGFEPPIIKVQVKSSEGPSGAPDVQALYGLVDSGEHGLFVALGGFTSQARAFARGKRNLRLLDGDDIVDLVLEHYEDLDSAYRLAFPLKRVFVPAPAE